MLPVVELMSLGLPLILWSEFGSLKMLVKGIRTVVRILRLALDIKYKKTPKRHLPKEVFLMFGALKL